MVDTYTLCESGIRRKPNYPWASTICCVHACVSGIDSTPDTHLVSSHREGPYFLMSLCKPEGMMMSFRIEVL